MILRSLVVIQLVDQFVNLRVGGGDFAVGAFNLRGGQVAGILLLVQFQHPVNQFPHLVVQDAVRLEYSQNNSTSPRPAQAARLGIRHTYNPASSSFLINVVEYTSSGSGRK